MDDLDFKFHNQSVLKIDVQGFEVEVEADVIVEIEQEIELVNVTTVNVPTVVDVEEVSVITNTATRVQQ